MATTVADWQGYAGRLARLFTEGPGDSDGEQAAGDERLPFPSAAAGRVVICSPHPDDEAIVGLLALRLLREAGCRVTNLLFTLGSNPGRRRERFREAAASCEISGFELQLLAEPEGLAGLSPEGFQDDGKRFGLLVDQVAERFSPLQPDLVLYPHPGDGHPTHKGVSLLVIAALRRSAASGDRKILVAQTECWQQLPEPNLLVGATVEDVGRLCAAVVAHAGEVARHPYHRRQPLRMLENGFRGSEMVRGLGSEGESQTFGELYRFGVCSGEGFAAAAPSVLPASQRLSLRMLRLLAGS